VTSSKLLRLDDSTALVRPSLSLRGFRARIRGLRSITARGRHLPQVSKVRGHGGGGTAIRALEVSALLLVEVPAQSVDLVHVLGPKPDIDPCSLVPEEGDAERGGDEHGGTQVSHRERRLVCGDHRFTLVKFQLVEISFTSSSGGEGHGLCARDSSGSARHVCDADEEGHVVWVVSLASHQVVVALALELVVLAVKRLVVAISPRCAGPRARFGVTLPDLVRLAFACVAFYLDLLPCEILVASIHARTVRGGHTPLVVRVIDETCLALTARLTRASLIIVLLLAFHWIPVSAGLNALGDALHVFEILARVAHIWGIGARGRGNVTVP